MTNCTLRVSPSGCKILKFIWDCIFPIRCLGCGKWDVWLCEKCLRSNVSKNKARFKDQDLDGLYFLGYYQKPFWQKVIKTLKYRYVQDLGKILSQELNKIIDQPFDVIVPVPLHRRRFHERGFNQAAILAKNIEIPNQQLIIRKKYTIPQADLLAKERKINLKNIFALKEKNSFKKILLVDDVYTTGTTLNECAKILKNNGAQTVWGAVVVKD